MNRVTADLLYSVIEIAKDYEATDFNEAHVKKWLSQFPTEHHELILKELNSILGKTYMSKDTIVSFFEQLVDNKDIFFEPIQKYYFINLQVLGKSQEDLLNILNEVVQVKHGITLDECGKDDVASYIYIDDAVYSGNRIIRDMQRWVADVKDSNSISRIDIIVLALHSRNYDYVMREIKNILPDTQVNFWRVVEFSDSIRRARNKYESFWPSSDLEYNHQTNQYITAVNVTRSEAQKANIPLLRRHGEPASDNYFTSSENRMVLEKIFFEKGVEIVSYAANPNPNMRPMGYDNSKTLGFGSYFVTYRNIANNCPVVLWWGNLDARTGINNWYPLFPRITN